MRPGRRKLVQAQVALAGSTPVPTFEPAAIVSVAPLTVSWRGSNIAVPYLAGLILTAGQSVVLVVPPSGTPFVMGVLTGP